MAQHVILPTGGVPVLVRSDALGRTYPIGVAVWSEGLEADQAFVVDSIPAEGGAGDAVIAHAPVERHIPWPTDAEPILLRSGTGLSVPIAGAVVRGVGSFAQSMAMGSAAAAEVIPTPTLALQAARAWLMPVMGVELTLIRGKGGYSYAAPGILMRATGAFDQTWSPASVPATGSVGVMTLALGRVSWALGTTGQGPSQPIHVLS